MIRSIERGLLGIPHALAEKWRGSDQSYLKRMTFGYNLIQQLPTKNGEPFKRKWIQQLTSELPRRPGIALDIHFFIGRYHAELDEHDNALPHLEEALLGHVNHTDPGFRDFATTGYNRSSDAIIARAKAKFHINPSAARESLERLVASLKRVDMAFHFKDRGQLRQA